MQAALQAEMQRLQARDGTDVAEAIAGVETIIAADYAQGQKLPLALERRLRDTLVQMVASVIRAANEKRERKLEEQEIADVEAEASEAVRQGEAPKAAPAPSQRRAIDVRAGAAHVDGDATQAPPLHRLYSEPNPASRGTHRGTCKDRSLNRLRPRAGWPSRKRTRVWLARQAAHTQRNPHHTKEFNLGQSLEGSTPFAAALSP